MKILHVNTSTLELQTPQARAAALGMPIPAQTVLLPQSLLDTLGLARCLPATKPAYDINTQYIEPAPTATLVNGTYVYGWVIKNRAEMDESLFDELRRAALRDDVDGALLRVALRLVREVIALKQGIPSGDVTAAQIKTAIKNAVIQERDTTR